MSTYGDAPTPSWQLPTWSVWSVLATTLVLAAIGWLLFTPGPDGVLTRAGIGADWPFGDTTVEVYCRSGSPTVVVSGGRYALTSELRGRPDLETFDLDMSDDVWLRRPEGTKAPLGPVTEAATAICNAA